MRTVLGLTKMPESEPPKMFLLEDKEAKYTGIPEIDHPRDFYEFFDFDKNIRVTNYPEFTRKRVYGEGFDFDKPFDMLTITILLSLLRRGKKIKFRKSSTMRGVHIITDCEFLRFFDDPVRRRFTELRGYEWFWLVKGNAICSFRIYEVDDCFRFVPRYDQFQEAREIDIIRLLGLDNRKFHRLRLSRKKRLKNKYKNHKNSRVH